MTLLQNLPQILSVGYRIAVWYTSYSMFRSMRAILALHVFKTKYDDETTSANTRQAPVSPYFVVIQPPSISQIEK